MTVPSHNVGSDHKKVGATSPIRGIFRFPHRNPGLKAVSLPQNSVDTALGIVEEAHKRPGKPLFAFGFLRGRSTAIADFEDVNAAVAANSRDVAFVWVHIDLGDAASRRWLLAQPQPAEALSAVAEPVQRGRLFSSDRVIYGHLRDLRRLPDGEPLQPGALCVLASERLVITGRRIPLRAVEELRDRIELGTIRVETPFSLLTEFFTALNDICENLLQQDSDRLRHITSGLAQSNLSSSGQVLLDMSNHATRIARDMAYKRSAMLELVRERPPLFPPDEFSRFSYQIQRYTAIVEDVADFSQQCQFILEEQRAMIAAMTNRNLYILTVLSAILLPLSLVTSIFGMNVSGMPWIDGADGFIKSSVLLTSIFFVIAFVLRALKFF
jgi:zinc transporter